MRPTSRIRTEENSDKLEERNLLTSGLIAGKFTALTGGKAKLESAVTAGKTLFNSSARKISNHFGNPTCKSGNFFAKPEQTKATSVEQPVQNIARPSQVSSGTTQQSSSATADSTQTVAEQSSQAVNSHESARSGLGRSIFKTMDGLTHLAERSASGIKSVMGKMAGKVNRLAHGNLFTGKHRQDAAHKHMDSTRAAVQAAKAGAVEIQTSNSTTERSSSAAGDNRMAGSGQALESQPRANSQHANYQPISEMPESAPASDLSSMTSTQRNTPDESVNSVPPTSSIAPSTSMQSNPDVVLTSTDVQASPPIETSPDGQSTTGSLAGTQSGGETDAIQIAATTSTLAAMNQAVTNPAAVPTSTVVQASTPIATSPDSQSTTDSLANVQARGEFGVQNDIEFLGDPSLATPLVRITPASYPGDGSGAQFDAPEPSSNPMTPPNAPMFTGTAVQPLKITDNIYAPGSDVNRPNTGGLNDYSVFFSQFVTHDMVHSVRAAGPPIFLDGQFIPVSRTPAIVKDGVAQQVSSDTPTLDLGLVYGRNAESETLLREFSEVDGQRVAGAKLVAGGEGDVLPSYADIAAYQGQPIEDVFGTLGKTFLNLPPEALANQAATGDERANQTASLTAHHTIWHRNHNWHAEQLRAENPGWTDEQVYQGARALNEGEYQKVIYTEYLPQLIGENALSEYKGYDPHVDNSIINEWTTVGFRFGHDQTSQGQTVITEDGQTAFVPLSISSFIANNGQNIKSDADLGDFTRGQLAQTSQEIDGRIGSELREALFGVPASADDPTGSSSEFLQLNLPILDIHRGRDHGVSDYNQLRAGLGLETYDSLDSFAHANGLDQERLDQLKSVYSDVSEMDSIVGGLLEKKVEGSQMGETFQILNVKQFENTRDGDENFYLNRFADSPEILEQISNTSMSSILERNGVVDNPQQNAFQANTFTDASLNPLLPGFENGLPTPPPGVGGPGASGGTATERAPLQSNALASLDSDSMQGDTTIEATEHDKHELS